MIDERLSAELILLRKKRGLSQRALANLAGVSYVHICNIERGKSEPSISLLMKIAKALQARLVVKFVDK